MPWAIICTKTHTLFITKNANYRENIKENMKNTKTLTTGNNMMQATQSQ